MADLVVNDVTRLNPVRVAEILAPETLEEIVQIVRSRSGPLSVGGGRYSMGGQTAAEDGVQIDMRRFNRILDFSPEARTITVQTGARWRDVQERIDSADLAVKIMQTYSNFTVGGALSVNCHGRYVGLGPVILSVLKIKVVLSDGTVVEASRDQNPEIFFGCIGGLGALGVIVEATLELARNRRVARDRVVMGIEEYPSWFREKVRGSKAAVFHNADVYPPRYDTVSAVTWSETEEPATLATRLHPRGGRYGVERTVVQLIFDLYFGKQYRRYLLDPVLFRNRKVEWRNFEASYDVAELEPPSRERSTHVLQEYFVPVSRASEFVPRMAEILRRFRVNALNVSIRHAHPDPGALMAWAREEVFAFVLYYRQRTAPHDRGRVAVWTRELVDAAVAAGGTYYLPYQPHPTPGQFLAAYPQAPRFFALKKRLDPGNKFQNTLWQRYYDAAAGAVRADEKPLEARAASNFKAVFADTRLRDGFYRFLQNIYRLYPESRFHHLIAAATERFGTDQEIYEEVQRQVGSIAPFLGSLRYGLPALKKQQLELAAETVRILRGVGPLRGYVEIGTLGRYVKALRGELGLSGGVYLVNDVPPGLSPVDLMERGGLAKPWTFSSLGDYDALSADIPDASVDLATLYIGLHHSPAHKLEPFVSSIRRVLRPGGAFVLRDHDVDSPGMDALVGLAHDVFNAGLGVPWAVNAKELRLFRTVSDWRRYLGERGFESVGEPILQDHDPTRNSLLRFTRV
jgi:FAD/FMN-containing dehydrogenase